MRPGRNIDAARLPPDGRPARRFRVHPTPTGVVCVVALVLFLTVAPQVADPAMAGFVWAALLGLVLVGAAWPCIAVLAVRVEPADAGAHPTRAVRVGDAVSVPLRVGPRFAEISLRWVDAAESLPVGAGGAAEVGVPLTTVRRGRFGALAIRVVSDAPFGIVQASRAVVVAMPRPLEVGPRPIDVERLPEPTAGLVGDLAVNAAGTSGDTTRSVRPYVSGDPAHLVHWPTTARTGALVVREMEPPADRAVAVVVDLGQGSPPGPVDARELPLMPTTPLADGEDRAAEGAVARAAAVVSELRARGVRVLLCTAEPQPVAAEVGDEAMVTSRLAAASAGVPAAVPRGWSVLRVTPGGDRA